MSAPKKKLEAIITPPPNIGEMTKDELDAFAHNLFYETIKPIQEAAANRTKNQSAKP